MPKKYVVVRLVRMDGCMGHIRGDVRNGVVETQTKKQVYGDTTKRDYVWIRLEDGTLVERCADPHLWVEHDGALEYRD